MERESKARSGKERTAEYRARLRAAGEPPQHVVANAFLQAVMDAVVQGDGPLPPNKLIERAGAVVTGDTRFTQEGFDNVLSRLIQPKRERVRS